MQKKLCHDREQQQLTSRFRCCMYAGSPEPVDVMELGAYTTKRLGLARLSRTGARAWILFVKKASFS
jgi:hypothetical protein